MYEWKWKINKELDEELNEIRIKFYQDKNRRWYWQICDKKEHAFAQSTRFWYAKEDCVANCHYWLSKLNMKIKGEIK